MRISQYGVSFFIIILLCFCFSVLHAQQKAPDYSGQWKKIDELVNKGLTKSALAEVAKIYNAAKKDQNDPQIIKSLLYQVTLDKNIQENADVTSIQTLEKEVASAKEPAKSILESITAEMYWSIFQQQRWKIYNRTRTDTSFKKKDILTWSADDFHDTISKLYLASIKDDKLLKQTKLEPFDAIILKGNVTVFTPNTL